LIIIRKEITLILGAKLHELQQRHADIEEELLRFGALDHGDDQEVAGEEA
jgi:hypothetical protein